MLVIGSVDELRCYAEIVSGLSDGPFKDVLHLQFVGYGFEIARRSLELHTRTA